MAEQEKGTGPKIDSRISAWLSLESGDHVYQIKEIVWMDPDESRGLHHIFVDVVDEQGFRLAGEKFRVSWSGEELTVPVEEKPGEPWGGNYPMYATMGSYKVGILSPGAASDVVGGLGMGTPEDPHVKHHTSFGLRFVRRAVTDEPASPDVSDPSEEPEPDQEPEPQEPLPDDRPPTEPDQPVPPDTGTGPKLDARIENLLTLDLSGETYKLEEVVWMDPDESRGLHHIFVDVVDDQGRRLAGEKFRVAWSGEELTVPVEEKPGEPWGGNYPMYATMGSYSVGIASASGSSDLVAGLGMGTPEDLHVKHHTSFGLRFRKVS